MRRAGGLVLATTSWVLVASLAVPSVLAGQAGEADELIGTVIDVSTGAPVEGALVRLRTRPLPGAPSAAPTEPTALTGPDGRFRLEGVPTGLVALVVEHIAYGLHDHLLDVTGSGSGLVLIRISQSAIALEPVVVVAQAAGGLGGRSSPSSRNVITRETIAQAASSGLTLGDFLRREVAGMYVRRAAQVGGDVCLEFRGARRGEGPCRPPNVYLDGTAVRDPQDFFGYFSLDGLERIQVISASEAGTRFGADAGWGVLLLETRRTGLELAPGIPVVRRSVAPLDAVDWSFEETDYPWARVYGTAFVGNAVGLAAASAVMSQCMDLRTRRFYRGADACGSGLLLASGVVMSLLPALGGAVGGRLGGATDRTQGRLGRSILYSLPVFVPGFALASINSGSTSLRSTEILGLVMVIFGAPVLNTLADRAFRTLR